MIDETPATIGDMSSTPAMRDLRRLADLLERRGALILQARDEGNKWEDIARVAGMSVAGAFKSANMEKERRDQAEDVEADA